LCYFTAKLAELASKYGVMLHAFADDNQLYLHCRTTEAASSVEALEHCIDAISWCMLVNRLRLNADKTELIWTGTKSKLECLPGRGLPVTLGCDTINVSSITRVLGVLITPYLSLEQHIDAICAKCFFQLRQLRRVRRTLDDDSIAILVHAFVTSRIDYCISLLVGAPRTLTDKLQRVMNAAARIISNTRKFNHGLTNLLHDVLHWLDVSYRITFRLRVQVFQCLRGMAPLYLSELCRLESEGRRQLWSSGRSQLAVPRYNLATVGRSESMEHIAGLSQMQRTES